jgi:glycosyltransferase involved in cell wall biosynthesis
VVPERAIDVSVVVPTRDRSRMLEIALRSVMRQRDVQIEVIVVDDASSDDTPEVVAAFGEPRLRLLRNPVSTGPGEARNRGASEARGEWLAFLDDDDMWAPTKLSRQIGTATDGGSLWVYAGSVNVDDDLRIIHGRPPPDAEVVMATLRRSNAIPGGGSNVIVRRRAFEEIGGFDERFSPCEDWELWIRMMRLGPPAAVRDRLMAYRVHAGGRSRDVEAIVRAARRIELEHETTVDWGLFHRWLAQRSARGGDRGQALREFARAALAGQAREVGSDLVDLARAGLRRRLGRPPVERGGGGDVTWEDEAEGWLEELRRLQVEAGDQR